MGGLMLHDSGSVEVHGHGAIHKEAILNVFVSSLGAAAFARDIHRCQSFMKVPT